MSEVLATVIIPTHNHGDLIAFALRSVQAQTVQDIEILVIGDGITEEGRECVHDFARSDSRIRFFDFPKGDRHGELHRHKVLTEEARGQIVCYASDDDLLLPEHIESMVEALRDYDFAHPIPIFVNTLGVLGVAEGHLGLDAVRYRLLDENNFTYNFIALHGAAHTMELYRKLPFGWRTTPTGIPTDLYMWQQMLSVPTCRAVSWSRATMVHFPDSSRREWTREQRRTELRKWESHLINPRGELLLSSYAMGAITWCRTEQAEQLRALDGAASQ